MSVKQTYQVPKGEEDHYHLLCVERRHIEEEKRYEDIDHIVKLSQQEYRQWDQFKHINGFSSITMLHDPKAVKQAPVSKEYQVTYLGEPRSLTVAEMKGLLEENDVKYFKGAKPEKLVELINEIQPPLEDETPEE